jgi:hypothetical protein
MTDNITISTQVFEILPLLIKSYIYLQKNYYSYDIHLLEYASLLCHKYFYFINQFEDFVKKDLSHVKPSVIDCVFYYLFVNSSYFDLKLLFSINKLNENRLIYDIFHQNLIDHIDIKLKDKFMGFLVRGIKTESERRSLV